MNDTLDTKLDKTVLEIQQARGLGTSFSFIVAKTRRRGASSSIDDVEKESTARKQEGPEGTADSPGPSGPKRQKTGDEPVPIKHGNQFVY